MTGKIVKGIAGFYYVTVVGSGTYECKAKGIFRKDGVRPLVGDVVDIEITHEKDREANIVRIHERRNALVRPAASNIDQAMLLFALHEPDPESYLIDRFLVTMERQGIPVLLCFNKEDIAADADVRKWQEIYGACGYETIFCSAGRARGMEAVRERLTGRTTVLAGPSGVGKSTLTNLLQGEEVMETGEISRKLRRGRHTTRHAELIALGEDTWICDTPGFTSLFLPDMKKEELESCFPEFSPHREQCRFPGCAHIREPDCAIRAAVDAGEIHETRYRNYERLYEELKEIEKRRYS